jgi:hypothetical protein
MLVYLTSISHSGGNTQLWKDIELEQEPEDEKAYDDPCTGHFLFPQPPAEIIYAHENPLDGVEHEERAGALPPPFVLAPDEKTDSRRSGFGSPHLTHLGGSLSVENTICSNWCPHFGHRNSYKGIMSSLCCFKQ